MIGRFLILFLILVVVSSEVIELTSKNFEHLTQASTGATTGDWLVEFYAPWCGHCKALQPTYEKVAAKLDGEINVASVDVPANRDLGTRFDIKGFPTILFLSKGKVYSYKGRRTLDDIVEFARTGYLIQSPEDIPAATGIFGELMHLFQQSYKQARKDVLAGNYFTTDVFYVVLPVLFVFSVLTIIFIPNPVPTPEELRAKYEKEAEKND